MENGSLCHCISCDKLFSVRGGMVLNRCVACRVEKEMSGKFGSLIIAQGDDPENPPDLPMTQREWAQVKKEFYNITTTLNAIEQRKAKFIEEAMKAADNMVSQVEAEIGAPISELSSREKQLRDMIQKYMLASGRTEQLIKDMLVEVKYEIVNAGNRPLWSQISSKMSDLLGWSKEQLKEFVRANHSVPQFEHRMHITKLPPGRRQLKKTELADHSLVKIAEVERNLISNSGSICILNTPEGDFFLTKNLIQKNGLKTMLERQARLKKSLRITDTENGDNGYIRIAIEGVYAFDPNTVRAFISDRFPDKRYGDVFVVDRNKVAVELAPEGTEDKTSIVSDFFDYMIDTFSTLLEAERNRGAIVNSLLGQVQGISQGDLSSDVEDLSLVRERARPSSGAPGAFGSGTRSEDGIMSPDGGAPIISAG